jgi:hypothetical protein
MDLLDREIEPVVVPFGVTAELAAAVSQHAQELDADIAELFDELQQSNFCTNDFCAVVTCTPRRRARRRTASVNGSTRPRSTSSTVSRSAKMCIFTDELQADLARGSKPNAASPAPLGRGA